MSNRSAQPVDHPRAPAIRIAFRTFWRTLRHGYENLGTLLVISAFWLAGVLICLPVTLVILYVVQALVGAPQYEVLLLPVGPLTAALNRVVRPMSEERATSWRDFWRYFRADWRWSVLLTIVLVAVAILMQVNIRYYLSFDAAALRLIALIFISLLIVWLGVALYAFPLAVRQQDLRVRTILRNAVIMAVANAPGVLVSLILLLILCALLLIPPLFFLIPGAIALWGQENARLLLVASGYLEKDPIADRVRE